MNKEIWKDIPGYESIYQASNLGRIRTAPGKTTVTYKHGVRKWRTRILKGRGENPTTGRRVSLWKDGIPKDWLVARLIGVTFLGSPDDGMTINHKDGNRINNKVENLEWLSLADNIKHAFRTGLMSTAKPVVLLSQKKIKYKFYSQSAASRFLGRNTAYVNYAVNNNKTELLSSDNEKFLLLQY